MCRDANRHRRRRMVIKTALDLKNAGANWVDNEVIRDQKPLTRRKPDDIPAFHREMIHMFGESRGQSEVLRKTA